MRLARPATLLALSLAACGPGLYRDDAGPGGGGGPGLDNDSGIFGTADGGPGCTIDSDCVTGLVCVRSTGECVLPENMMHTEDPDAGQMTACIEGQIVTCGTSKIGECRLGTQSCVGGFLGPCVGAVNPIAERCNGLDDDCDGLIDEDMADLTCGQGVCLRVQPACVNGTAMSCVPGPASSEICNGLDDDCDGMTDEGLMTLSCGVGACARIVPACMMGMAQMCMPGAPRAETCNGADDDCNGTTDEGLGSTTCGVGACVRTQANCVNGTPRNCTPGPAGTESCNNIDDDCDGMTDEGLPNITCGLGACRTSVAACTGGVPGTCTPGTAGTETCNGIDDDCDGTVDDGVCAPTTMCPASRTVSPNTTVNLPTAAASPTGRPVSCQWAVVTRPATSNGTFSAPTNCASSNYFADVVGTHTLRFTVTDSLGLSATCMVDITVQASGALWVELTWSRNNDMDLHLQHPSAGNNHNQNGWSFNASGYDCYYGDTNPIWDMGGIADDPSLDRDDLDTRGPENIRINSPSTAHDYTIGVHWYSQVAAQNSVVVTVKVYCSGVLSTTQTLTVNSVNDMWVVGKVRFQTSGSCTFTPDGYVFNMP